MNKPTLIEKILLFLVGLSAFGGILILYLRIAFDVKF